MNEQMKQFIREKWNIALYFFFMAVMLIAVHYQAVTGQKSNIQFKKGISYQFSKNWTYEFKDGKTGKTSLPSTLPKNQSQYMYLKKTLPKLSQNTYLIFRARHTYIRILVDGKVLYDDITQKEAKKDWFILDGLHYVEVKLKPEYTGKEVTIESYCSEPKYLCVPGEIFLGERATYVLWLFNSKISTLICFILLMIAGFGLLALWLCTVFIMKMNTKELLCLALFTLSIGLWVYTESEISSLIGHGTRSLTYLAYEDLMLIPVPIALFFYYASEREIGQKLSRITATVPVILFSINNMLHLLKILSLTKTLLWTQIMLGIELVMIACIQIMELRYIHKSNHTKGAKMGHIPMVGIGILVPLALIEILKYMFVFSKYSNDGKLITLGVVFYIVALSIDSIRRMAYRNVKLEQNSEMKTQFLANMSHEIRTPLNAMLGFNEAIIQNVSDEKKVSDYAFNIREAGENLKDIINSILDISKIEMGQLQIDAKEYNSIQLLDNLSSMFEMMAKKKGLNFVTDIDPNLPEVMIGDEAHIKQILTNLLNNAIKYTESGTVTLSVKKVGQLENNPIARILFSVKDTGRGIREEDRERLFYKFERLDTEHFKHTEGTGLGMSIVLYTLKAMGSEIKFESTFGKGSEFYFELEQVALNSEGIGSFVEKRKALSVKEVKTLDFRVPNAKVLIVDDVEMNIDAACALLEFSQMQIDKAISGQAAIEAVKKKKYDVIFMDHMMPEMDGIEATEKIRNLSVELNDAYYAMVPIIALSANTLVGMREMYQQAGMQDFVSKPIEISSIIGVLKKWLPKELIESASEEIEGGDIPQEKKPSEEDWELGIDGIEGQEARKYNASVSGLEKNMHSFILAYENNKKQLEDYFFNSDIHDYVIKVHGLKSTSKMIGALELSEMAKGIEEKGNQGKMTEKDLKRLLQLYEQCVYNLREYFGENNSEESGDAVEQNETMSEEDYQALIQRIKNAADSFDAAEFMNLEEELVNVVVADTHKKAFQEIRDMVSMLSFGQVSEYIQSLERD